MTRGLLMNVSNNGHCPWDDVTNKYILRSPSLRSSSISRRRIRSILMTLTGSTFVNTQMSLSTIGWSTLSVILACIISFFVYMFGRPFVFPWQYTENHGLGCTERNSYVDSSETILRSGPAIGSLGLKV